MQELDGTNKELTNMRYSLEAHTRELNAKLKTAEEVWPSVLALHCVVSQCIVFV